VGYADLDTLRKTGNNAALWILVDFEKPPFDGNNLRYLSLKMHNEYDCERAQFRVLSMTSYSEKMARGEQRYKSDEAGEWESISPKTIQKKLWEVACGKRYGIKTNKNLN
ncbi:MAG: hypothetical protein JWM78_2910, partial [Verrucomicrobiaceae bacterium]|nr:hypothetical protein [Verrucomicrobiaceae bacterium]